MEIAPGFTCEAWKALDLSKPNNNDWEIAISVLRSRMTERYIDPVDILIDHEKSKHFSKRRFGFTILAIDCLLIETLQAFKDGNEETKWREGKSVFVNYLTQSSNLGKHFNKDLAAEFYLSYRNGILHQAQIKENHLVWSIGSVVDNLDDTMIINRTEFHKCLKKDFDEYLNILKDINSVELRSNFKYKMDTLCK